MLSAKISVLGAALVVLMAAGCSSETAADALPDRDDAGASTDSAPPSLSDSGANDDAPSSVPDGASVDAAHDGAVADAAPPPLPTPPVALVKCLDAKPYVEQTCTPTTVAGWPHPAQACTYSSPIGTLSVTVADPSASQVATWIVDAGDSIPAIAHLKTSDPTSYLRALQSVATALMFQSSRIFPISGAVGEDQGGGTSPTPSPKA